MVIILLHVTRVNVIGLTVKVAANCQNPICPVVSPKNATFRHRPESAKRPYLPIVSLTRWILLIITARFSDLLGSR